ncbi:MAG: dehydrogenase [Lysobacterales bacterium CG17_big_fil_post_rev_8_21_14_2_50_64_11]|nr:MAG: dehydrogenase [Xanthomonadales bacterium CG17_big_fil_post_rev_8_21_14_2_50_64_11]PIX59883.1 MAG: dehydrogenase [Xanthomonadales bacterium CG_4_10_14_3_um_filter_64_11]
MTRQSRFRACPLCEAICGLELQYQDDALVAIRGDAHDPFSRGHICPKGNALLDLEADPDRLRQPMQRLGERWQPIAWDTAFALAGERLAAIASAHGTAAIAAYLGNPNVHHFGSIAYAPALLRLLKSPNIYSASSVDQWPHQFVNWAMYGHQFLLPIPDIDRTDCMLMLGANPVVSNGSLMTAPGIGKRLKALSQRGQLIVVDPRRTQTAQIANRHLFIRPGTDALFLAALLQQLQILGPPRCQHYRDRLDGLDTALAAINALPLDSVSSHTGIAQADIADIAKRLHQAPSAAVYGRMGLSTQRFGSLCQWLIQLLNLYTGNLDREGGTLINDAAMPITGAGTAAGHYARWHSRVRGLPEFAGELPVSVLAEEIDTAGNGQIRALITSAGNPVLSTPDGRRLERALGTLEFMLSIDTSINETTRFADLILPPASPLSQYHYDLIFNAFAVRRVARLSVPLREPHADERGDWQIFNATAQAYAAASGTAFTPLPEPLQLIAGGLQRGHSGIDLTALLAAPHGIDLGPLTPCLLDRLQTADRKIHCAPAPLLEDLPRLVAELGQPATAGSLRLIGRRHPRSNNSWMHNAPRLVKGKPRHQLHMHPDDLAARGIASGSQVRIRSAIAELHTEVLADADLMPGVVCLPHGFGHGRAGSQQQLADALAGISYNDLSDPDALDGPTGNAALNGLLVTVEA